MTATTIPPTPNPQPPPPSPPTRLLIINPNTTGEMTSALAPAVLSLSYPPTLTQISYFTCPAPGIPSINSPADAAASAQACIPHLQPLLASYDAFLVACYSEHPLVRWLAHETQSEISPSGTSQAVPRKYVKGIFEASVTASLSLIGSLGPDYAFGIVSTGKIWEEALRSAVSDFLGASRAAVFLGCETTGLDADQLHRLPPAEVRREMRRATGRLVERGEREGRPVRAVCLGCAGMVGLEEAVREELVERMGSVGWRVAIVDGVKAGVGELVMLARAGF